MLLSGAPEILLLAVSLAVHINRVEVVPILVGAVLVIHVEATQMVIARMFILLPDLWVMDATPGN
jgi:hypothetical protein